MSTLPCADCAHPEHCTGSWPDDDRHRPGQVRGCFAEKARTASLRGPDDGIMRFVERKHEQDMDAYKRLRADGVQPKGIYAASAFEATCDDRHVIEGKPDPAKLENLGLSDPTRPKAKVS